MDEVTNVEPIENLPEETKINTETETETEIETETETDTNTVVNTKEDYTNDEQTKIESVMKSWNLPKDISYFKDKDGSLKFSIPIDGKKYIATPAQVFTGFNINQAGYRRMEEANKIKKEVKDFFTGLKDDPKYLWDVADKLGINKYELAESLLSDKIKEMEMDPRDRALIEERKKRELLEEEHRRIQAEREESKFTAETLVEQQKLDTELVEAMKKHGLKNKSPNAKSHILSAAIGKMMLALQYEQNLSADEAVALAVSDWQEFVKGGFSDVASEKLIELIPPEIIQAIRKADMAKLSLGRVPTAQSLPDESHFGVEVDLGDGQPMSNSKKKSISISDYFSSL